MEIAFLRLNKAFRPLALSTGLLGHFTGQCSDYVRDQGSAGSTDRPALPCLEGWLRRHSAACCQEQTGTASTQSFRRSSVLTWNRALIFGLQAVAIQRTEFMFAKLLITVQDLV